MDERDIKDMAPGMVEKAASLTAHEVTDEELKAINAYALEPLKADDVFTFRAVLCDNELDRQHERFTLRALKDLQKLFKGKTVIKDHLHRADNQVARIYETELEQSNKTTTTGEAYTRLVAKCYMVKTPGNADLIAEIKGGIKKEGSVGCVVKSAVCSICGTDNAKTYCRHWPGRSYEKDGVVEMCTFTLDGAKDAYEFSLVAVPAQKAAGVSKKSYGAETIYEGKADTEPEQTPEHQTVEDVDKAKELALRARLEASKAHSYKN